MSVFSYCGFLYYLLLPLLGQLFVHSECNQYDLVYDFIILHFGSFFVTNVANNECYE